jgi:hypothetical protein
VVAGSGIAADGRHLISRALRAPVFDQLNLHAFNTAALKTFAPAMRRQLIEAVGRKYLPLGVSIKAIHWESC